MTEAELAYVIGMNRQAFGGILQTSVVFTLAIFFLAYVIRRTPVFVRAGVFVVFLLTTFGLFMVMNIVNDAFTRAAQDLAAVSAQTNFAKGLVQTLGATPTEAGSVPAFARIISPLIFLLNLAIGFYLLLMAKWEDS